MPIAPLWVPHDILCVHHGVAVFRDYRDDDSDSAYTYWYAFHAHNDPGEPAASVDVRELAAALGDACPDPLPHDDPHAVIFCAALDAGLCPDTPAPDPTAPAWPDWIAARNAAAAGGASFFPRCPFCGYTTLSVTQGAFNATDMALTPDGFAFADARHVSTSDETVECGQCHQQMPLGLLTC